MFQSKTSSSCVCSHHAEIPTCDAGVCACGQTHAENSSCKCKGLNPFRRFHSVAGFALGLFLVIHIVIAATALSPRKFNQNAVALGTLRANLPFVEFILIFIPLLILIPTGAWLLIKHGLKYNVKKCNRGGKPRFFLQRASAIITLFFLIFHLIAFGRFAPRNAFNPVQPYSSTYAALHASSIVLAVYLMGILAVCYHLANGLFTAAHAWKLLPTPQHEKTWKITTALFAGVFILTGLTAWFAFFG
jgi:succinate dehydrogenase / fumarate reductase, cytochrome b subunit